MYNRMLKIWRDVDMGRRLALYSDILEKMSIGIDEYINYYSTKVDKYKKLSALRHLI